jgi:hypothetical protein
VDDVGELENGFRIFPLPDDMGGNDLLIEFVPVLGREAVQIQATADLEAEDSCAFGLAVA